MASETVGSEWTAHNLGAGDDRVKQCSKCFDFLPATYEYFYHRTGTKDGLAHQCRECKDKQNRTNKLKSFGLTDEEYDKMFSAQGGTCAICHSTWKSRLYVDHCHKTGRVRGLLCQKCNSGLGMFNDDRELLLEATEYLREVDD